MLATNLQTIPEVMRSLAERARALRLSENLTQDGLATRAGVSLGSLKRFERTGQISLESLVRIALTLNAADAFEQLFRPRDPRTLDEILATARARERGRRR